MRLTVTGVATLKAHRPFSTFHFELNWNARLSSTPFKIMAPPNIFGDCPLIV